MKKLLILFLVLLVSSVVVLADENENKKPNWKELMLAKLDTIIEKIQLLVDKDLVITVEPNITVEVTPEVIVEAPEVNVTIEGGNDMPNRGNVVYPIGAGNDDRNPRNYFLALPNGECTVMVTASWQTAQRVHARIKLGDQLCGANNHQCSRVVTITDSNPYLEITGWAGDSNNPEQERLVLQYIGAAYSCI